MSQRKDKKGSKFRVNLDRSRAPRAFRGDENLWRDDLRRLYRLVGYQAESVKKRREDRQAFHAGELPHLSIAAFGPSGSGKSSLLRTLADDVKREHGGVLRSLSPPYTVFSLPVIDPTTWSASDQFLYAFLAAALEEERKHQEQKEHGPPQGLSPVQLAFQDVNEYLRVVDDPGTPDEHDPLGLSLQKLERHTSGLRLRHALGKFVDALADEFSADVVLLPVDDLDMAPAHLVESLQTYQSFLTHSRLVPIFTFTDRMPEELIEVHYEASLSTEESQRHLDEGRLPISQQLAVQFLARCFPVRNRIRLGPAPARVQRALYRFRSVRDEESDEAQADDQEVLELLIHASFLLFGHPDKEDAHKVRAALRPSTLRRQFQVVDAMADCRLKDLRIPQFATWAHPEVERDVLEGLATGTRPVEHGEWEERWKSWPDGDDHRLGNRWHEIQPLLTEGSESGDLYTFAKLLRDLNIGATWATVFNGATWSLLNVHRDTLRELGLFLEDLYSWSPKELRTVVLNKILAKDRVIRRTVVDRWFNRTDFRRSQVLSLLAANIFRPWMIGEEPYGDEELAVREQLKLEREAERSRLPPLDQIWDESADERRKQVRERLSFPATQGLLWFLNVSLGFYLPQVMARNWADAMSQDEPVRGRMSGNGWDLYHAPNNAVRVADAKREAFAFGMMFLHPRGYRHALEAMTYGGSELEEVAKAKAWKGKASSRGHLLLRLWSCCGYSRGRFWAAFSLWRGLSFVGQVLELAWKERRMPLGKPDEKGVDDKKLLKELRRLIHSHCIAGLVPGSLLDRGSNDERLLEGFPRWEAFREMLDGEVECLAGDLVRWLVESWEDRILPLPAGDLWVGWRDCFVRRVHGEYILGSLWPRLKATYMEKQQHSLYEDLRALARQRSSNKPIIEATPDNVGDEVYEERFRWLAAHAADAWSDILLDYWRGCPQILLLLLTCPVFFKSRERFGCSAREAGESLEQLFKSQQRDLRKKLETAGRKKKDKLLRQLRLNRLSLQEQDWRKVLEYWKSSEERAASKDSAPVAAGFVPDELCIERVPIEDFNPPKVKHQSVALKRTRIDMSTKKSGTQSGVVVSESEEENLEQSTKDRIHDRSDSGKKDR